MTDDERAESRVAQLIHALRDAPAPAGDELPATVVRTARWQRPFRRVLVAAATAGGGIVDGFSGLVRGRRRR